MGGNEGVIKIINNLIVQLVKASVKIQVHSIVGAVVISCKGIDASEGFKVGVILGVCHYTDHIHNNRAVSAGIAGNIDDELLDAVSCRVIQRPFEGVNRFIPEGIKYKHTCFAVLEIAGS